MAEPPQPPRGRSKYTEDVQLPGAFEGETVSRRRFMTASASTAGLVAAAAFTLPALGFAIAPVFDRASATWQEIGSLSRFTESDYVPVVVTIEPGVGEAGNSIAYVRKHNLQIDGPVKDQYDHVIAISSRCVHVGCPVRYVAASQAFVCPCHGGVYDFRGIRTRRPQRRPARTHRSSHARFPSVTRRTRDSRCSPLYDHGRCIRARVLPGLVRRPSPSYPEQTVDMARTIDGHADAPYVSTGDLPDRALVQRLVDEAHELYRSNREGQTSQVYPALARVPAELFGVCVLGTDGIAFAAADADHEFTIMSVSKPFVFALVCGLIGPDVARQKLGVNSTGLPFNSLAAVERTNDGRTNPMVNAGAIAATSLASGSSLEGRWRFLHEGLSRFAGRELSLDREVYSSASATNSRNQSIARLLQSYRRLYCDPSEAVDLYTRQCSLRVSARDLATMGAALADGGVNPLTKERVVDAQVCHYTLAVMLTAGLYENSGEWLYDVGLPAKSGIGGGIVTVSPGKGGMGTFAPPLDDQGNSVKGQLVAKFLSARLGMDLLISTPAS
jgi:glutaminase